MERIKNQLFPIIITSIIAFLISFFIIKFPTDLKTYDLILSIIIIFLGVAAIIKIEVGFVFLAFVSAVFTTPMPGFNHISYVYLALSLIIGAWIFRYFIYAKSATNSTSILTSKEWIILFIPFILNVVSFLINLNRFEYFNIKQILFHFMFLLLPPATLYVFCSETIEQKWIRIIFYSMIFSFITLFLIQLINSIPYLDMGFSRNSRYYFGRGLGKFAFGGIGMFSSMFFLIGISFLVEKSNIVSKLFYWLLIIFAFFSILGTYSITSFISITIGTIAIIIMKYKSKLLPFVFLIVIIGILNPKILNEPEKILSSGQYSLQTRYVIWKEAWSVIKDNMVIGIGPDNYKHFATVTLPVYLTDDGVSPHSTGEVIILGVHNDFLQYGIETGVLGMVSLIILILFIAYKSYHLYRKSDDSFFKPINLSLIGINVAFAVQSVSGFSILPSLASIGHGGMCIIIYFWILLGISFKSSN